MGLFRCYRLADRTDVIRAWFDLQEDGVQGQMTAVLEILDLTTRNRWPKSLFKPLRKKPGSGCQGLVEILLKVEAVHYRILGFCGPRDSEITLLYPFKKNDDPTYRVACAEAQTRKAEVRHDWRRIHECSF
jgi:hypothetical protein